MENTKFPSHGIPELWVVCPPVVINFGYMISQANAV